ncbi:MAG TPA: exo-beta-N-acetylmuramidase NamZ domain-containing protein, partial [Gemmataceae bacterium]|nr:exo-beta-N-acetylmuramidase NamZ domain-containing protein [Gemmataceae bacterium]
VSLLVVPARGADLKGLDRIEHVVHDAIQRHDIPGAVVAVLHRGEVVYRKAFGNRAVKPAEEPMTVDTVFDLASLTKPLATATSVMKLVEQGKLKIDEKVVTYWPEFAAHGKDVLTLEHLLRHTSGLIADNPISDYADGPAKALERICQLTPRSKPGERFVYSDVNFIVLGVLAERVSGMRLDEFAKRNIYVPLGMRDTGFLPGDSLKSRCAPTEQREGRWMRGEVHDPRAYALGGVAGHAGLFGTADDILIYAKTLLNGGGPVLKPETVALMTTPKPIPTGLRGLGWDVRTSFSSNKGTAFPRDKGFGHTGFTGTSIWVDPDSQTAVVFLSNRVHPEAKPNINRLRGQVATIVAEAVGYRAAPPRPESSRGALEPASAPLEDSGRGVTGCLAGIDVLIEEKFARLKGRSLALVTNHTGRDRQGRSTIDLLHKADGVKLLVLFSPEHGLRGTKDERVGDGRDEATGLPVYSLYGPRRKPTPDLLQGVDTIVYDIQDIGCRFYTYSTTLKLVMESAAENKLKMVVLDRPNPIGGVAVAGPVLEAGRESFIAAHTLPLRHGMTFGELAQMYKAERKINVDLEVVKVQGWKRGDLWDRTLLPWVNPSPNMRSLLQALVYPGIGLLETTNVSVGRGTDQPFEWVGAPWIDGRKLAAALDVHRLPGVRFVPTSRTPSSSVHAKKECGGVQIYVDDWSKLEPVRVGMTIAVELRRLYPNDWQVDRFNNLLLDPATIDGLKAGKTAEQLERGWQAGLERFKERRKTFFLYEE